MLKKLWPWLVVLLVLLEVPRVVQAQTGFRPGYIVLLKGDTLRGSISYSRGKRSSAQCRFKPANAAAATTYLPSQLQGYGFPHDRFFQSQRVAAANPVADTVSNRMFLEVLVQGPASLYYIGDDGGDHYYIRSDKGPAQPLVQLFEMVTVNGSRFKRETPLFRTTLAAAFQACPAVRSRVETARFGATSFTQLCREYNACVGGRQVVSEVAATPRRSYFLLEAVAGVQSSNLHFSGLVPMDGATVSGGVQPVVGVALQQYLPVLSNRLGVRLEVLYQRQRYNEEVSVPSTFPSRAYQEVRVNFDQLRVPLLLRYMPLNGRFQPFIEAGASFAFALTNSNEFRYRALPTSAYSPWGPILDGPRSVEGGILAGLGAAVLLPNKHHLGAALRAERTNGFSAAPSISTAIRRAYFLLSYDLSKPRSSN